MIFIILAIPSSIYLYYVVMIVTPRVLKYNGIHMKGGYAWYSFQTLYFVLAFHPTDLVKRSKYYKESLQYYTAEPRDIKHFQYYKRVSLSGLVIFLSFLIIDPGIKMDLCHPRKNRTSIFVDVVGSAAAGLLTVVAPALFGGGFIVVAFIASGAIASGYYGGLGAGSVFEILGDILYETDVGSVSKHQITVETLDDF